MNAFQDRKNNRNRFIIAIVLRLRTLRRCQICVISSVEMLARVFRSIVVCTVASHLALQSTITYDFHSSNQHCRVE